MESQVPSRVIIDVIDHDQQRYPTVGDYVWEDGNVLHLFVSRTKTPVYAWFVAVHELVESILAAHAGIAEPDIAAFDCQWEAEAARGKHDPNQEEPGSDPRCPIVRQHNTAELCERIMVQAAGVNWDHDYEPEICMLWNRTRPHLFITRRGKSQRVCCQCGGRRSEKCHS